MRLPAWLRVAAAMFAVGWGANQFAALLLAYRAVDGVSPATADALFAAYAVGLVPALLLGGPLSDRLGRRALTRPAVVLSAVATLVLVAGHHSTGVLYLGRALAGVASGLVFAPGTAWVKELSSPPHDLRADGQAGARRAAVALSAGFGLGPLVAGLLAQWWPHPLVVPYVAHLLVVVAAGLVVWRAPETVVADPGAPVLARLRVRSAGTARFRRVVAPLAPWVFGAASVSLTLGPALVAGRTGPHAVAFAGLVAGLTLGTGVLVQPLARRLAVRGDVRGAVVGLAAAGLGCALQAAAAVTGRPLVALAAALVLGTAYGCCLVAGLLETQRVAPAGELAGLTAVYYALTYAGFAVPIVLTSLAGLASYATLLGAMAVLALVTLGAVVLAARRTGLPG